MKKDKQNNALKLIEADNINKSTEDDGISFVKLGVSVAVTVLILFYSLGFAGDIFIDNMSPETQAGIEKIFSRKHNSLTADKKYDSDILLLNRLKNEMVQFDENLQNRSQFFIYVYPDSKINAFCHTDGSIGVTQGLLDEKLPEEQLAFVLGHELGHYAHKDHLKSQSRKLMMYVILSFLNQNTLAKKFSKSVADGASLSHSRKQELNADRYGNEMVIRLYGTNKGAVDFIKSLEKKEKLPSFFEYFSTHPSWKARLKNISDK